MSEEIRRRQLATLAYENAGREISQVFDGINSNTALAAGTLAAILAVLGAGELFADRQANSPLSGIPRLSSVSLVVLAAALPLLWRFFMRAVTAYQNLLRFNAIQREAWSYLNGERSWAYFRRYMDIYWHEVKWASPKPLHGLMWDNLKYGFGGIFAISVAAVGWAFVTATGTIPRVVAGAILGAALVWEGFTLEAHRRRFFRVPSGDVARELEQLRCEQPDSSVKDDTAFVEESRGLFLGMRRLRPGGRHL